MAKAYPRAVNNPVVVIIGGGGGTAAIYPELTRRTSNAIAVLGTFDSGGSTGRLSDALDVPATGDFRNVMLAATLSDEWRELREQRFNDGELRGHPVGNLVVAACFGQFGIGDGVKKAMRMLQVPGTILPVTLKRAQLVMEDGTDIIEKEDRIDVHTTMDPEPRVWLKPEVDVNPEVVDAIKQADLIVIPGGSVYTSLLAALSPNGIREALAASPAPKVLLTNLATEQHQTDSWHVADFVLALKRHGVDVDMVLYNTAEPTAEMLANYAAEGERPVDHSPGGFNRIPTVRVIGAQLLADVFPVKNPNDPIKRGLMRHDAGAVCDLLWQIMGKNSATHE